MAGVGTASAAPVLPNLAMSQISDLTATLSPSGREQLRFSATIVNLGPGRLEVRATRPRRSGPWLVQQRIFDSAGGPPTLRDMDAQLVFGGDGHNHWHVRDLELYELRDPTGQRVLRRQRKRGFCFFDTTRVVGPKGPGPKAARYPVAHCGGPRSLGLTTGLSVGWGDRYPWSLPDQFIDVTGLPPGDYRLVAEVDHQGVVLETDEAHNETYLDLRLRRRGGIPSVTIIGRPTRH